MAASQPDFELLSVFGPILFALYMLPLGQVLRHFKGISYMIYDWYVNDIQLYIYISIYIYIYI